MKPWDIYTYDFGDAGPHPAIIVSHPDRVAKAQWVNVLFCTTQRANRPPKETEVRLNGADGLDWETLCAAMPSGPAKKPCPTPWNPPRPSATRSPVKASN